MSWIMRRQSNMSLSDNQAVSLAANIAAILTLPDICAVDTAYTQSEGQPHSISSSR